MAHKIVLESEPYEITRTYPYRLGFLNDIHVGGQFGLFPNKWKSDKGNIITPSGGQRLLKRYMYNYAKHCKDVGISALLCAGDMTAGSNPMERGEYIIDVSMDEQKEMAADVIAEFCSLVPSIKKILLWNGTGYHGSRDTSDEKGITDLLAKRGLPAEYHGAYSFIDLEHNNIKKRMLIMHTAPDASMYPEQAMGKDMLTYQEAVAQGKLDPVDMIIRAHKHNCIEVHKPTIRSIQLPCWQFYVPYDTALKQFAKFQPDIGSVIMLFDEQLRTTVWHFIYKNVRDPERYLTITHDKGVGTRPAKK
jgi:hypothetical protein